jgi:hypothetical protein
MASPIASPYKTLINNEVSISINISSKVLMLKKRLAALKKTFRGHPHGGRPCECQTTLSHIYDKQ